MENQVFHEYPMNILQHNYTQMIKKEEPIDLNSSMMDTDFSPWSMRSYQQLPQQIAEVSTYSNKTGKNTFYDIILHKYQC